MGSDETSRSTWANEIIIIIVQWSIWEGFQLWRHSRNCPINCNCSGFYVSINLLLDLMKPTDLWWRGCYVVSAKFISINMTAITFHGIDMFLQFQTGANVRSTAFIRLELLTDKLTLLTDRQFWEEMLCRTYFCFFIVYKLHFFY